MVLDGSRWWAKLRYVGCEDDPETGAVNRRTHATTWFAQQMNEKLQANLHKGGWESCDHWWLFERLLDEVAELEDALIEAYTGSLDFQEVVREAADVGNFAMMIADLANIEKQRAEATGG